jgi:hypothetical protein
MMPVPLTLAMQLQSVTQASLMAHTPAAVLRVTQALIATKTLMSVVKVKITK